MSEFDKMLGGQQFDGGDDEIMAVRRRAFDLLQELNRTWPMNNRSLLETLFASVGEGTLVVPPFHCEFGKNITIGRGTLVNMGATVLDGAAVRIGDDVMIGPSCQIYTPSHSLDHRERKHWESTCLPITIEDDVWIGGSVVICQGVTIGARSVVAAGSKVTRDVPPDTLVAGTPVRTVRQLNDAPGG